MIREENSRTEIKKINMKTELDKQKKIIELPIKMPLITEDDLFHNELIGYALYLAAGIFLESKNQKYTTEELYILRFYHIINRILSCYKCINQAYNFIKRRPTFKELDKNEEMTVIDYYNYHYDVVIHKLSTIKDLSFKLINKVFDLKLKDKDCTWNSIRSKKDLIFISGVLDIQTLHYHLMNETILDRNESSHNGSVDIKLFRNIDGLVQISQWKRLELLSEDDIGPDPMEKSTYYDYLQRLGKKELLRKIKNHKAMSLFCIHILTCCMANKFKSDISKELLDKYSTYIQKANCQIDTYERKVNKLGHLLPYLIENDKSIEYLKSHEKDKNHRLFVTLVHL